MREKDRESKVYQSIIISPAVIEVERMRQWTIDRDREKDRGKYIYNSERKRQREYKVYASIIISNSHKWDRENEIENDW